MPVIWFRLLTSYRYRPHWSTSGEIAKRQIQNREILIINIQNIQVLYIGLKMNFLLIQPLCQISKRLYGESISCDYLRTVPRLQNYTNIFQPSRGVTNVRNSAKINHLPLMIFIWLHSQDSQLHSKCLFCSIKSLFMSQKLCFVGAVCSVIQWLQRGHNRHMNTY